MPCVGLVVLVGCFTFIIVPEAERPTEPKFLRTAGTLPTIVIDPGHGGNDDGARGHGLREKDETLDVALRLDQLLKNAHFPTALTRREDVYVSLPERVAIANRFEDSIFVSIHFNQSGAGSADGVETYYADLKTPPEQEWTWVGFFNRPHPASDDNGETLAGFVQAAVVTRLNVPNRGIKGRSLYVVRNTRNPAVLVEGGFISNSLEAQMLTNADYRNRLAAAVAEGIVNYVKSEQRTLPQVLASSKEIPKQRRLNIPQ